MQSSGWSGRVTQSPLLYVLTLEPLLLRLRNKKASLALHGILFVGPLSAKVSAYTNDITVFMFCHLDIKAVKKAVVRYKQIVEAKIHFDKSKGLRLGAWKSGIFLSRPFHWSDRPIHILGVWFRPRLQLERNWLEVQAKIDAQVGTWLQRRLSLKGKVEVCAVYIS